MTAHIITNIAAFYIVCHSVFILLNNGDFGTDGRWTKSNKENDNE